MLNGAVTDGYTLYNIHCVLNGAVTVYIIHYTLTLRGDLVIVVGGTMTNSHSLVCCIFGSAQCHL